MVKRNVAEAKTRRSSPPARRPPSQAMQGEPAWFSNAAIRETIESVIIAFVLAFLFRTFEAEAFVIPTGSMAPTLMGKHKDLECPMCHYRYQVSASDDPKRDVPTTVYHSTCPMCRYTADLDPKKPNAYPSYDGDRILVAKFPHEFADPKPWDVIVFKFPGDATMNYIKRLVGLPGETIRIHNGDLWIRGRVEPKDQFVIARKPPEKVLAMLQPVYDNDLAPTISGAMRWPPRWTPEPSPANSAWTNSKDSSGKEDLSSFEIDGKAQGAAWIRYRHRVPRPGMWDKNEALRDSVPPQLISDFTAYNTGVNDQPRFDPLTRRFLNEGFGPPQMDPDTRKLLDEGGGQHWVGDLAVQFELESTAASGKVAAELVKGGCRFQCRLDLATGKAELAIVREGLEPDPQADQEAQRFHATSTKPVSGAGKHTLIFSNVDDELRLWVADSWGRFWPVAFDAATTYDSERLKDHMPRPSDLSPVGIASEEAAVKVRHIKILRDIYYIAVFNHGEPNQGPLKDFNNDFEPKDPADYLSDPQTWPKKFNSENMRSVDIELDAKDPKAPEKDQFFAMGDNSAQSSDGRLWVGQWTVERELLIGKALVIYWPHGWSIPYVPLPFNVVPYFQRMHLVR